MKLIKTGAVFLLIAVLLIIGISVAFADSPSGTQTEGISAIKLGTAGISNGNYVYYGKLNGSAVKWRVLDNDATNTGSNTGMFLISEYMIYNSEFNNTTTLGTYYQNSVVRSWCMNFADPSSGSFTAPENGAMIGTAKSDGEYTSLAYGYPYAGVTSILNGDKVFLLSAEEAVAYLGSEGSPLIATYTNGGINYWWLRSYVVGSQVMGGVVYDNGHLGSGNVLGSVGVRPAFNLNLSSVLFTSAAVNGKYTNHVGALNSTLVADDVSEWKATLYDSGRSAFTVSTPSVSAPSAGGDVSVSYSGAALGINEYISAMIVDGTGSVAYYGRLKNTTSLDEVNGTQIITIPALTPGTYTLKVFSEQYNGGTNDNSKLTDYSSPLRDVTLTVTAPQLDNALHFDGINDYVSVPDNDDPITDAVTIETWIKSDSDSSAAVPQAICEKGPEQMEILAGGNAEGGIRFRPTTGVCLDANSVLPAGVWTHVAVVYKPSEGGLAKMYINGNDVSLTNSGSNPITTPLASTAANFLLGRRSDGTYPFQGALDDFRIWNRALTQNEIRLNMVNSLTPSEQTGLVSVYSFNQGFRGEDNPAVTTLTDETGYRSGTLTNFALTGASSNWVAGEAMSSVPNYTVTYDDNGATTGTAPADLLRYVAGAGAVVKPTGTLAKTNYTFTGWNTAADGSGAAHTAGDNLTVTENTTLYAQWLQNRTVTVANTPSEGGSVSGSGTYPKDTQVTVTATANNGYTFVNWTENGSIVSTDTSYTFTMGMVDRALTANFVLSGVLHVQTLRPTKMSVNYAGDHTAGGGWTTEDVRATLNGAVNPGGSTCTVYFEYGTTGTYGSVATAVPGTVSGSNTAVVRANITGLRANIPYHCRIVMVSDSETFYGQDLTFFPSCDSYEIQNLAPGNTYYDHWINGFVTSSDPEGNIEIVPVPFDDETYGKFNIINHNPFTMTIGYNFNYSPMQTVTLAPGQLSTITVEKTINVLDFYYNNTLYKRMALNKQATSEDPLPQNKLEVYGLGYLGDRQGSIYSLNNRNSQEVTVQLQLDSYYDYLTVPANSIVYIVAPGTGILYVSYNFQTFAIVSSPGVKWQGSALVTAVPKGMYGDVAAFALQNNDGVTRQIKLKNAAGVTHDYTLSPYEHRTVTIEKSSWDLYMYLSPMLQVENGGGLEENGYIKINNVNPAGRLLSHDAVSISGEGGSISLVKVLDGVCSWTAVSNRSWLTVSPAAGNTEQLLTFTAEPNLTGAVRNATVTVADGDSTATVVITQSTAGQDNALSFDGINDHVSMADNDDTITDAVTIETWVKWAADSSTDVQFICGKDQEHLEIHTGGAAAGRIRFIPTTQVYLDADGVLPTGVWTHVAVIYQPSSGLAKMYINGNEVSLTNHGSNSLTSPLLSSNSNFVLGERGDGSFPFKGTLDNFRVWNRVLTQNEIRLNMVNSLTSSEQTGLVNAYNFNQGFRGEDNTAVTTLTDETGYRNGTLTNFTLTGNSSNWVASGAMSAVPSYTVTYDGNGATSGTIPADTLRYVAGTGTVVKVAGTLAKTGYTFTGWNKAANGSGDAYNAGDTLTVTGNTTLYAQWLQDRTVTVSASPVEGGSASGGGTYPKDTPVTVTATANSGYTFVNWTENGNFVSADTSYTFTVGMEDRTLVANFISGNIVSVNPDRVMAGNPVVITATGHRQNATGTVAGEERYIPSAWLSSESGKSGAFTLTGENYTSNYTPSSAGVYTITVTFQKQSWNGSVWNNISGSTDTKTASLIVNSPGITYCTVTYNGNGSTGGIAPTDSSSPYNSGTTVTVLGNTGNLVKSGCTFVGWNTKADGTGTNYAAGATFTISEDITLYARWLAVRANTLDLTLTSISYVDSVGVIKTADPTTTNVTDSGEEWEWYKTACGSYSSNTLVLKGAKIQCTSDRTGIKLPENTTIILADNTTTSIQSAGGITDTTYGINGSGALNIAGAGTLQVTGGSGYKSFGIYSGADITISDGTVNVTAGDSTGGESFGICGISNVTLSGGTIIATGGVGGLSMGIASGGTVTISGAADVTAAGNTSIIMSYGIYGGSIAISGGTTTASTADTDGTRSAMYVAPSLTGSVTCTAGAWNGQSVTYSASTTGTISGTVTDGTNPTAGANVSLTVSGNVYSATTAVNGSYSILNVPAGTGYTVTAGKSGYTNGSVSNVSVTANATTQNINITLTSDQVGCLVTYKGAQKRYHADSNTYDIRFIAIIDTLNAKEVGFVFSKSQIIPTRENAAVKATTTVYTSITAAGSTVTAASLGGTHIIACTVTGIPVSDIDIPLHVRAFSTVGTVTKYTPTATVTVNSLP